MICVRPVFQIILCNLLLLNIKRNRASDFTAALTSNSGMLREIPGTKNFSENPRKKNFVLTKNRSSWLVASIYPPDS